MPFRKAYFILSYTPSSFTLVVADQTSLTTIGNREVVLTVRGENTYANGVLVRGGITLQGGRGSVLFLDKVLWVDQDVVNELNSKFG